MRQNGRTRLNPQSHATRLTKDIAKLRSTLGRLQTELTELAEDETTDLSQFTDAITEAEDAIQMIQRQFIDLVGQLDAKTAELGPFEARIAALNAHDRARVAERRAKDEAVEQAQSNLLQLTDGARQRKASLGKLKAAVVETEAVFAAAQERVDEDTEQALKGCPREDVEIRFTVAKYGQEMDRVRQLINKERERCVSVLTVRV